MGDLLPAILPHSQRVHAAPLWPAPLWYSPHCWWRSEDLCPACAALARAAGDVDRIEETVAGW